MSGSSPWSVKGIAPEERELAKQAARRAGVPIGAWLSQQIRDSTVHAEAMATGHQPAGPAAAYAAPAAALHPAADRSDPAHRNAGGHWRRAQEALASGRNVGLAGRPEQDPGAALPAVRASTMAMDPARVRDLERRVTALAGLEERVDALQKIDRRVAALAGRLDEVNSRIDAVESRTASRFSELSSRADQIETEIQEIRDRPAELPAPASDLSVSTAPIERAVMRLSDRLQRVEELTLPDERKKRGFWSRLFSR